MEIDKQRIAELVSKVQKGDNSAFDELYRLTSERAYFVALQFTKNNQDAEDILQESYIKALSKIKELDKPESFSSWLNQIVANKSKDFLKKKKPMLFEAEENEVFEAIPDEDTEFSPEENLDQTELQKTVMEVLDELSEEKRACVLMMYFEELSVGEIAQTLEIPEGTVKTRLFSARKDLKEKFSKRGITSAFSFAPIGVVIWAMKRAAETVQTPAAAKMIAGITVAGTGTAAGVAAAGTTAAAGTGIAAKIAALTVAQKVIAGVSVAAVVAGSTAGVVTVANKNAKKDDASTTAYTEEYTTAPNAETTLAIEALGTVEFSETTDLASVGLTDANLSTSKQSTTKPQGTSSGKTTVNSAKATTKSVTQTTSKKATTTKNQTASTAKTQTTTQKQTTTKKETTTEKATTTKATTKAATTQKQTTTTKPTTTEATTKGKATIIIDVIGLDGEVIETLQHSVDAGTEMSGSYLWDLVEAEGYSISGVFGSDKGSIAESGQTYTFEAEI